MYGVYSYSKTGKYDSCCFTEPWFAFMFAIGAQINGKNRHTSIFRYTDQEWARRLRKAKKNEDVMAHHHN